jgi:hypothetical protein
MQHGVAAIRGIRSRTSFVLPSAHRMERQLGLHRVFRTPSPRSDAAVAERQPLHAVRRAARSISAVTADRVSEKSPLVGRSDIHWTRSVPAAGRRTSASSSARWRG